MKYDDDPFPDDPAEWQPFMHGGQMLYPIFKRGDCIGCVAFDRAEELNACGDMPRCRTKVFKLESPEVIAEFTLQRLGVTNET